MVTRGDLDPVFQWNDGLNPDDRQHLIAPSIHVIARSVSDEAIQKATTRTINWIAAPKWARNDVGRKTE